MITTYKDYKTYYKIVNKIGDEYYSLFHGTLKSRKLPKDIWIKADNKLVRDGSGGTYYMSGFHILETEKECKYLLNHSFKSIGHKVIVPVYAKEITSKEHSRNNVYLANYIFIINDIRILIPVIK